FCEELGAVGAPDDDVDLHPRLVRRGLGRTPHETAGLLAEDCFDDLDQHRRQDGDRKAQESMLSRITTTRMRLESRRKSRPRESSGRIEGRTMASGAVSSSVTTGAPRPWDQTGSRGPKQG